MANEIPGAYGLPNTPQGRKVVPLLPQIIADPAAWPAIRLAKESGIARSTATLYLQTIAGKLGQETASQTAEIRNDAMAVASRVRDSQIAKMEQIETELAAAFDEISDGFLKTGSWQGPVLDQDTGEEIEPGRFPSEQFDYDSASKARILLDLLRGHGSLNQLIRSLSGQELAEKVLLARVKGEATGQAIGRELVDFTATELSGELFKPADPAPALIADQRGELAISPAGS